VDSLRTRYLIANVGAVVGVLAAAGAVIFLFAQPPSEEVPRVVMPFDIQPVSHGAAASWRASF
jgi:hypothetical protein